MTTWPVLALWMDFGGTLSNPADPASSGDWSNIGSYIERAVINRGVSRFDGVAVRYEAGTATAELRNTDARFDPVNSSGPYFGQILPRREWALQATWSGVTYKLWRGFTDEWKPTYPLNGANAITNLRGSDGLSIFAQAEADAYDVTGFTNTTGGRIGAWVAAAGAGWVHGGISTVGTPLQSATSLSGNVLQGMQLVTDTEIGELYFGGDGFIVFRLRDALLTETRSKTSQGTFDPGTSLPFTAVEVSYDAAGIRNYISIARVGGTAQVAFDQDSIDAYQRRSLTRTDLLHTTNAASADYAGYVLHLLKDPELRIDSVTINPQSAPSTLFPQVLARELGDRITVSFTPPGGSVITRDCFIRGIAHSIAPGSWSTRWTLQDASRFGFFTFDHATLGKFDTGALGY